MFDSEHSLDPTDWSGAQKLGRLMLDQMLAYLATIEDRPVWQPATGEAVTAFQQALPEASQSLEETFEIFREAILPYAIGNAHPGFMGWAHGGGSVVGMLAEMLAAGLNANLGGRDHIPIAVEGQVVRWMSELFGFPEDSSGLFVTGSSMANLMGLLIARTRALGVEVRKTGVSPDAVCADGPQPVTGKPGGRLIAYTSTEAHGCIAQAMEISGLGSDQLRRIGVDSDRRMDIAQLQSCIERDLAEGHRPFCVVGSAGTVDVGAIDDLAALAGIARQYGMWFHVDGACGALGVFSPRVAHKLNGIEHADSIALDFHKWGQVPYDAGFLLVRDRQLHYETFASPAAYLRREKRGMAAGSPWPCDYGPDLSRSFKALKVWFTLKVYGIERLGKMIEQTCDLAEYLAERVANCPQLELVAPVALNIVCFRYREPDQESPNQQAPESRSPNEMASTDQDGTATRTIDWNRVNADIVVAVQESGLAAPSTTTIDDRVVIRAAIFNHRTTRQHIDRLVECVLRCGDSITQRFLPGPAIPEPVALH